MFDVGSILSPVTQTVGSLIGYDATRKAANTQADAMREAAGRLTPYSNIGAQSVNTLYDLVRQGPGQYQESPYYNFLTSEGLKGMQRGFGARGMAGSGAAGKAYTRYASNMASTDYQNWLNNWYQSLQPYQSMAGLGASAAGAQIGPTVGAGTAQAGGILGQANTAINWLNAVPGMYGQFTGGMNSLQNPYYNSLFGEPR